MSEGIDWLKKLHLLDYKRLLCLVDGEHYPPVTEWALETLEESGAEICGLVFAGGTEKIGKEDDGLFDSGKYCLYINNQKNHSFLNLLRQAVEEQKPDLVLDLSDVPVMNLRKRLKIASHLLKQGVSYAGADFIFTPPANEKVLDKPSITIFGTGKRVGKTATSITISRILKQQGIKPAVVAMGRGGPSKPQIILPKETELSPQYLLEIAGNGDHAASDYWENALLSGIPSIGCRRCGGGLAGNPLISNVPDGARMASKLPVDIIIMEGSGPTLPPIKTDIRIVVIGAHQPTEELASFFDEYRLISSDLAILTMCEEPIADDQKLEVMMNIIKEVNPNMEIALTVFRPDPLGNISNKKVFLATTAPDTVMNRQIKYLEQQFECEVVGYSTNLSNRKLLKQDLRRLDSAEVLLTEIKAASIDVAAKAAQKNNQKIIFLHNELKLIGGTIKSLDVAMQNICKKATAQHLTNLAQE